MYTAYKRVRTSGDRVRYGFRIGFKSSTLITQNIFPRAFRAVAPRLESDRLLRGASWLQEERLWRWEKDESNKETLMPSHPCTGDIQPHQSATWLPIFEYAPFPTSNSGVKRMDPALCDGHCIMITEAWSLLVQTCMSSFVGRSRVASGCLGKIYTFGGEKHHVCILEDS